MSSGVAEVELQFQAQQDQLRMTKKERQRRLEDQIEAAYEGARVIYDKAYGTQNEKTVRHTQAQDKHKSAVYG